MCVLLYICQYWKKIAEQLKIWLTEKKEKGEIPLVPLAAREGYSRPEQFKKAESFLENAAGAGK